MEINGDVTMETNKRKVKIGIIFQSTLEAKSRNISRVYDSYYSKFEALKLVRLMVG